MAGLQQRHGYVEHFAWPEGASPAYVVQTVDDGWLYEFRPADVLPYLPPAKHVAALRERLGVIDRGPIGSPILELPRPKFTRFSSTSVAHVELFASSGSGSGFQSDSASPSRAAMMKWTRRGMA